MARPGSLQANIHQLDAHTSSGIVEGSIELAALTLDDSGMIRACNRVCEQVFGYPLAELAGRHISTLFPQLLDVELVQEDRINSRLAFLCRCAIAFRARHRDGRLLDSELFVNRLGRHNVAVLVRALDASRLDSRAKAA